MPAKRGIQRHFLPLLAALGLWGCAPLPPFNSEADNTLRQALDAGFHRESLADYPGLALVYSGATLKKSLTSDPDFRILVFLEGDGAPWSGSGFRPPSDPTPRKSIVLALAIQEVHLRSLEPQRPDRPVVVVYLSRPCQFVTHKALCSPELWASERYGDLVLRLMDEAISQIISSPSVSHGSQKTQPNRVSIYLIGHSGGGTMAALLAGGRADAVCLITLASPLDLAAWTRRQNLSPLAGSIDPARTPEKLAKTQSHHFLGGNDRLVDRPALGVFADRQPGRTVDLMTGVSHSVGWERNWKAIRDKTCLNWD